MKIAHLTSVHRAFDVRIFHKECHALAEAGHEVILVAPHDTAQVVDNIRIVPLPCANSRLKRMTTMALQLYRTAAKEDAQVYHFHDPELIPVGLLLKRDGNRVIYDVHEDVPQQILNKRWIPGCLRKSTARLVRGAEAIAARYCDRIVAATPSIAAKFPSSKTVTVQNFPIIGELSLDHSEDYAARGNIIAYVGGIGSARGAREMVEAMSLLPEDLEARLVLAGDMRPAQLEEELRRLPGWERTEFLGWQSRDEVAQLLGRSRIGLVLFHPAPNHFEAYPNKLFEYMSAAIPVIASDFPLWCSIIEQIGCGVPVEPLSPETIAETIQWLLEHPAAAEAMGKRGQQAVIEKYNWDIEKQKLLDLYERLL